MPHQVRTAGLLASVFEFPDGRPPAANLKYLLASRLWAEAATAADLAAIFRERDEAFRSDLREDA